MPNWSSQLHSFNCSFCFTETPEQSQSCPCAAQVIILPKLSDPTAQRGSGVISTWEGSLWFYVLVGSSHPFDHAVQRKQKERKQIWVMFHNFFSKVTIIFCIVSSTKLVRLEIVSFILNKCNKYGPTFFKTISWQKLCLEFLRIDSSYPGKLVHCKCTVAEQKVSSWLLNKAPVVSVLLNDNVQSSCWFHKTDGRDRNISSWCHGRECCETTDSFQHFRFSRFPDQTWATLSNCKSVLKLLNYGQGDSLTTAFISAWIALQREGTTELGRDSIRVTSLCTLAAGDGAFRWKHRVSLYFHAEVYETICRWSRVVLQGFATTSPLHGVLHTCEWLHVSEACACTGAQWKRQARATLVLGTRGPLQTAWKTGIAHLSSVRSGFRATGWDWSWKWGVFPCFWRDLYRDSEAPFERQIESFWVKSASHTSTCVWSFFYKVSEWSQSSTYLVCCWVELHQSVILASDVELATQEGFLFFFLLCLRFVDHVGIAANCSSRVRLLKFWRWDGRRDKLFAWSLFRAVQSTWHNDVQHWIRAKWMVSWIFGFCRCVFGRAQHVYIENGIPLA